MIYLENNTELQTIYIPRNEINNDVYPTGDYSAGQNINISRSLVISVTGMTEAIESAVEPKADSSAVTEEIATAVQDMATQTWVNEQGFLTEHQSLSAYSTTEEVEAMITAATSDFVTSSVAESMITAATDGLASEQYVNDAVSGKADTSAVTIAITSATQDMATQTWVGEQGYATIESLSAYSTTLETQAMITAATDGLASTQYVDNSVSGKADSSAVTQDISDAVSGLASTQYVDNSVSGKADYSAVTQDIANAVSGLASTQYVDNSVSGKSDSTALTEAVNYLLLTLQKKPVVVWEAAQGGGILSSESDITQNPSWQITGLDFSPYKRLKFFIAPGGSTGTTSYISPAVVVEMTLDDRATCQAFYGHYTCSYVAQYPNDRNRLYAVSLAVSSDKTSVLFARQTSLYGTAATTANDNGRYLYKILGFYD